MQSVTWTSLSLPPFLSIYKSLYLKGIVEFYCCFNISGTTPLIPIKIPSNPSPPTPKKTKLITIIQFIPPYTKKQPNSIWWLVHVGIQCRKNVSFTTTLDGESSGLMETWSTCYIIIPRFVSKLLGWHYYWLNDL